MAIPKLDVAAKTDPGLVRTENQDTLGPSPETMDPALLERKGRLYIVADGMGGHAGGSQASQIAVRTVFERYYNDANPNPAQSLKTALKSADLAILREAGQNPRLYDMGTTLTAALVRYNSATQRLELSVAHVGDSRAYLLRGDDITLLTRDHTLVQEMVERRTLSPDQARTHPDRHKLSQALSSGDRLRIDVNDEPILLQPGDKVLLSSDGLHDVLDADVIRREILGASSLGDGIDRLISLTKQQGAPDNVTALIVSVPRGGRMTAAAGGGRRMPVAMPLVGAGVAFAIVAGLALFINRGVTEPQRRLAEARNTATALAVVASTMVTPTAAVAAGQPPGNSPDVSGGFFQTATAVAAERVTAVARVNVLETEVAAKPVQPTPRLEAMSVAAPLATHIPTRILKEAVVISPNSPASGTDQRDLVNFGWAYSGVLPPGAHFRLEACTGGEFCKFIGKRRTNKTSEVWCPDEEMENETIRWRIVLVDSEDKELQGFLASEPSAFRWLGGCSNSPNKPKEKRGKQFCKDNPLHPDC